MKPIRAIAATVRFFEGLDVDGYRMPDGSFRIGVVGTSRILGYGKDWLNNAITGKTTTTLDKLSQIGFTNTTQPISAQTTQGNWFSDNTISLQDFQCCLVYAVRARKKAAEALNKAFVILSLTDFFRDAFGDVPLTIEEKRHLFYQEYAAFISPEDWRQMDKQDIINLALVGDEPHLKGGYWNE